MASLSCVAVSCEHSQGDWHKQSFSAWFSVSVIVFLLVVTYISILVSEKAYTTGYSRPLCAPAPVTVYLLHVPLSN